MTAMAQQTKYRVDGMDCAGCAAKIDRTVRRMPGVADVSVSVMAGTMTVHHDDTSDLVSIERQVTGLGYQVVAFAGAASVSKHAPSCGHDHSHDGAHDHHHDDHHHEHHDHDHGANADLVAEPAGDLHGQDHGPTTRVWWQTSKGRLTITCGAALGIAFIVGKLVPALDAYVFTVAMLIGLIPIARRAVMATLAGTPFSIEMLMTIAAIGAVVINAAEEAGAVVFLFLVGELLEGVAAGRARASIQSLTKLVPKTAWLEEAGQTREVPADSVAIGAILLVRPGDRIPADGVIISGESTIDEAPVTGESVPVRKGVDAQVFAGTINGEAALRTRVTAAAADNTIARVVRLVEEAQESKAPTERFIDRFSTYYTPAVVVIAALVAVIPPLLFGGLWTAWIYKGLAILLIGCPCALVISTPAAIAASLSAGARRGLLLKGGAVLETLGTITMVAFDKTGTLTEGKPGVTDVVGFDLSEREVLTIAAALEVGSSHPLGAAILARAAADLLQLPPVADASALGGKGITATVNRQSVFLGSAKAVGERVPLSVEQTARIDACQHDGKTVSVLIVGEIVAGFIALRDEPRADAIAGLKALDRAGIKTVMLTGDNARAASAIGRQLGMEVRAELLPEDKLRIVTELQAQGFKVAKVGDGINDAPALAAADVGIAMGGGTDVALETADAAVLNGRVIDVARIIELSKRTMGNIHQNITIALGLKALFLITTIVGITGLWPAILADTGATVLVTLNALRLLTPQQTS